jgi:hypothetical protein
MWRAIIFGCVLTIATATAGERSPGNDLNNDGGPKDRRHWRERHWRDRQEDWRPRYQPRYIIPPGPFPGHDRPRRRQVDPWARYNACTWTYGDRFGCEQFAPLRSW